jgi:hypothetical protein
MGAARVRRKDEHARAEKIGFQGRQETPQTLQRLAVVGVREREIV